MVMTKTEDKKISEKLLRLIEPFKRLIEKGQPKQRLSSLLLLGSAAWNYSVTGQEEVKNIVLEKFDGAHQANIKFMLEKLVARKLELFPDDDRLIVECTINSMKRDKYDITVAFLNKEEYENSVVR
jgi:hypothetical protein